MIRGFAPALLLLLLLLGACGKQQSLRPRAGEPLPPQAATSPTQPGADQLLASHPRYRPGRSDELLSKSQVRSDDRFDKPPQ